MRIYRDPKQAHEPEYPGDIVFDIEGLTYFVDIGWANAAPEIRQAAPSDEERYAELRRLAEAETEITITNGTFDQDIGAPQRPFPGGGLTIEEYHVGRLTLVNCGDNDYWQYPDGSFSAPAAEIEASRQGTYGEHVMAKYPPSAEQKPRLAIVRPE